MKCYKTTATYKIKPYDSVVKTDLQHVLKLNLCQKLLEPVSECKQLYASIFLHIVSTQDLKNVIIDFLLTNNNL